MIQGTAGKLKVADGNFVATLGNSTVKLYPMDGGSPTIHTMVIAEVGYPLVIGVDYLTKHGCSLDLADNTLRMGNMSRHCRRITKMPRAYKISMADTVVVPPMCKILVPGRVEGGAHFTLGIVEERDYPMCHGNEAMSKIVIRSDRGSLQWLLQFKRPEGQLAR